MKLTPHRLAAPSLLAAAALMAPASVSAATVAYPIAPAPTIAVAFTPTTITDGGTTALSVTITNPSSSTVSGLQFSDTLPAGVVIDDPNGESGTCGSTGVVTATPGANQFALFSGSLAKGASCTVSADVTSANADTYTDSTGPLTYTGATTSVAGVSATLSVVGLPRITISGLKPNRRLHRGAKLKVHYSCQDASGAPGITSCVGDVASGKDLDTRSAGKQSFSVTATSADGGIVTQTVNYTVLKSRVKLGKHHKQAKHLTKVKHGK